MAVDASEMLAGLDHAGRAPAQGHSAVLPVLHVLGVLRQIEIIDSTQFVLRSVRARVGETPRRSTVNVSARPSRSDARINHGGSGLSLGTVGAVLGAVGLLGLYGQPRGLAAPTSLAASGVLLEYSVWMASRYAVVPPRVAALMSAGVDLRRGLIAALVVIAGF